ncbi:hypothetical protein [Mycobacterium sp. TKK-01-0059]|uniref:hypothetical protein n=1 Tax=Mycobacterium sp. TKK-01-0059 TaxID=1324269 RepID=UPI0012DF650C|nr:hypothetical protein [Mycobacterium sp. TKK-01-0059]
MSRSSDTLSIQIPSIFTPSALRQCYPQRSESGGEYLAPDGAKLGGQLVMVVRKLVQDGRNFSDLLWA